jgi:hypothetical protein
MGLRSFARTAVSPSLRATLEALADDEDPLGERPEAD